MKNIFALLLFVLLSGCAGSARNVAADVTAGVLIGGVVASEIVAPRPYYYPYYRHCNRYGCWY